MSSGAERRRRQRANSRRTPTPTPTPTPPLTPPPPLDSDTPLSAFFAQFESFSLNPKQSSHKNFDRLIRTSFNDDGDDNNNKDTKDRQKLAIREEFKDALVQEFNEIFGTDVNDPAAWKKLCELLEIVPVPDTIVECRKLVWDTHVNIVDLVEAARTGQRVKLFNSLQELTDYTLGNKKEKLFPKNNAYQGGMLKELLRELMNPYHGKRRNGSAKRKERKKKKKNAEAAAAAAAADVIPTGVIVIED